MPKRRVIRVVDSARPGTPTLSHSIYAIVYTPSWLRVRAKFKWKTTMEVFQSLSIMKEYFWTGSLEDRPYRAQRCFFSLKALQVFGYKRNGQPRFAVTPRTMIEERQQQLNEYIQLNPVVAWDWIVSWSEARAMAEAYPEEYVRMFRRLRSHRDTKRKPKTELQYFIDLLSDVAQEKAIDLERK